MGYDAFISYSHSADGELAPAIRDGLQRFAKPWNRRRALSVFLDQASLEVSAGLKDSLQHKLGDADWLILLLSEASAGSRWVGEEIEHWLAGRPKERIALVQTSGEIAWDDDADDFDLARSTAVPEALRGVYSGQGSEPLWLDLRWAAGGDDLDLRNTRFRDAVATLAAPIHGRPKDELEGEDIRQHRRLVRLRRAAITGLTALTVIAVIAGVLALLNARRARAEARTATARLLASQSRDAVRPDQAVLVALEAMRIEPNTEARGALLDAVRRGAHAIAYLHDGPQPIASVAVHPTLPLAAAGGRDGVVALWDLGGAGEPPSAARFESETGSGVVVTARLAFHPVLAVLYTAGTDRDIKAWDVADPDAVRLVAATPNPLADAGLTPAVDFFAALAVSPDGRLLAAGGQGANDFALWDLREDGAPTLRGTFALVQGLEPTALAFDAAGGLLAIGTAAGFELWEVASAPRSLATQATRTPTGVLAFEPGRPTLARAGDGLELWDVADPSHPEQVAPETGTGLTSLAFTPGGVVTGGTDGRSSVWQIDAAGGPTLTAVLAGHGGQVLAAAVVAGGTRLLTADADVVAVWDGAGLGGPGALGTALPGEPVAVAMPAGNGEFWTVTGQGRLAGWERGATEPRTSAGAGNPAGAYSIAAAGDRVVVAADVEFDLGGPPGRVVLWDAVRGAQVWATAAEGLAGEAVALAPDGRLLAAGTALPGATLLWDLETPDAPPVVLSLGEPESVVAALAFDADAAVLAEGSGSASGGAVRLWDVTDPAAPQLLAVDDAVDVVVRDVSFSPDGSNLVAGTDSGQLLFWARSGDEIERTGTPVAAHAGPVQAVVHAPGGATVVSAGDDGRILVWDAAGRTLVGGFVDLGDPVTGLAIGGDTLISVAGAAPRGFARWTVDPEAWRDAGCAFANREMTAEEWARFGDGGEPVAHCDR